MKTTKLDDVEAVVIACLGLLDRKDLTEDERYSADILYGDASSLEEKIKETT